MQINVLLAIQMQIDFLMELIANVKVDIMILEMIFVVLYVIHHALHVPTSHFLVCVLLAPQQELWILYLNDVFVILAL